MAEATKVRLGDAEIPVVAQSGPYLARLEKELPDVFGSLSEGNIEGGILSLGWDTLYTLTAKLIPAVSGEIPRYRWNGYSTRELYDEGAEPDEIDAAPKHAEVIDALECAVKVNRLDVYKSLGKMLGGLDLEDLADSLPSSTSPSTNGASPSKTPSGTVPTSIESGD